MNAEIERIRALVLAGQYRNRSHCVRHMIEEGFDQNHLLEAVEGELQLIEVYPDEARYLVLGYFHFMPQSSRSQSPLHLVCDLTHPDLVDIVTAYIPQRPWWDNPKRRGENR